MTYIIIVIIVWLAIQIPLALIIGKWLAWCGRYDYDQLGDK